MPNMPRLQEAVRFMQMSETNNLLGSFGGDTSKEVRLFSNRPFVALLERPDTLKQEGKQVDFLVEKHGENNSKATGCKDLVKSSQEYPAAFGLKAAESYTAWRHDNFPGGKLTQSALEAIRKACPYFSEWQDPPLRTSAGEVDLWDDAEMQQIAEFLGFTENPVYFHWEDPCSRCMRPCAYNRAWM